MPCHCKHKKLNGEHNNDMAFGRRFGRRRRRRGRHGFKRYGSRFRF